MAGKMHPMEAKAYKEEQGRLKNEAEQAKLSPRETKGGAKKGASAPSTRQSRIVEDIPF